MTGINYIEISKSRNNNFDKKIKYFLDLFNEKIMILFIDIIDLNLMIGIGTIIYQNSYSYSLKLDQSDIEKLYLLILEGNLRIMRLFILNNECNLIEFSSKLIDIMYLRLDSDKRFIKQGIMVHYYSENFFETEILFIENDLFLQVEKLLL